MKLGNPNAAARRRRRPALTSLFLSAIFLIPWLRAADGAAPNLFIEGYAGDVSYKPGEDLVVHISTTAPKWSLEIARLGALREIVWSTNGLPGREYPVPENASANGCNWPEAVRIPLPASWRTGFYQLVFRASDSGGQYIQRNRRTAESDGYFVLRPASPGSGSSMLLQLSCNTYNAYNNWGGSSLYAFHGRAGFQGHRVSFQRPSSTGLFNNWEAPFVAWAESQGYTLDFCANSDLERHPELLNSYRLVLSVGHDEYWSTPMRDHLENFIARGGNVAFFSGNTCCWQVRTEDAGHALTCWKQNYAQDPLFPTGDHTLLSTLWGHHLVKRPENQLTGVGFLFGGYHLSHGQLMDGKGAYTVHRPDHWLFSGTGLKRGDEFGATNTIVGYECDGCEFVLQEGLPVPTGRDGTPKSFTILGTCPARWHPDDAFWYERFEHDRMGASVLGFYTNTAGATVFTCGSTDWAHGLRGRDPIVEQITRNVFDRLGKRP